MSSEVKTYWEIKCIGLNDKGDKYGTNDYVYWDTMERVRDFVYKIRDKLKGNDFIMNEISNGNGMRAVRDGFTIPYLAVYKILINGKGVGYAVLEKQ